MKSMILSFDYAKDTNQNAAILEKVLRDEFAAECGNFTGYRFVYNEELQFSHKRAGGDKFKLDCSEMRIKIFRNLNAELATMLIEGI